MKITFQTSQYVEKQQETRSGDKGRSESVCQAGACKVDFLSKTDKGWAQGTVAQKEKGKSLIELQQDAAAVNAAVQQDYMTVMSHTLSEEDYAKLSEEGFHFANIDPETAVTIVDRIKAELAKSGQIIVGYTDDLDMDTLAAAVGSESLARAVADSFSRSDLPLTEENLDQVKKAWDMASQLQQPGEGAYRYMVDNGLEPEIWDFYLAENSGARAGEQKGCPRYFAEEIQGYYTQSAGVSPQEGLQDQVDQVIARAGLLVDEESRKTADWLMERGLPLTEENLKRLTELESVVFPVTEEAFAEAAAHAVAEGKNPVHADLSQNKNIYERAADALERYQSDELWETLGDDITARRQLEEIRLRMTAEVNVKLLKSGFSIDTAPMEKLLEALKQAESRVAEDYFPNDAQAVEKYQTYNHVNQVIGELPAVPAQTLGTYISETDITLSRFHEEAKASQESYERANESYEALMTAPRSDLGDSIRKAFANVDDILRDLDLQVTEENRRAVRILGYNRMELTVENIDRIREADQQVRDIINRMTPASTLKMIRDGINPLEKSFEELENYFDSTGRSFEESAESYSRFLYGLEKKHDITPEEREAYIGVYRMIHQIESSDGAVVGALVNSQAQLQFSNLLSAVRSGKFKHMDVKVEDAFGAVSSLIRNGETISEQIAKGFARDVKNILEEVSYDTEAQKDYDAEELSLIREAALTDAEAAALLQRGEIPESAGNLLAAQALLQEDTVLFQSIYDRQKGQQTPQSRQRMLQTQTDGLLDAMSDKEAFQEEYMTVVEELKELVQDAGFEQADTSVDVRGLQMMHKQLAVAGKLAGSEEYVLPMYIGDELAKVHLTFERGGMEKGSVHISVNLPREGHIEAHFTMKNGTLRGILIGNTAEEVTKIKETADIFTEYISGDREGLGGIVLEEMPVMNSDRYEASIKSAGTVIQEPFGNMAGTEAGRTQTDGTENIELYRIAKVFLQAVREEEVVYENQL